jgi:hypothetical protein
MFVIPVIRYYQKDVTPLFPAFSLGSHTPFAIIVIISGKIAQ